MSGSTNCATFRRTIVEATRTDVVADILPAEIDVRFTSLNARNRTEHMAQYDRSWRLLESPAWLVKDRSEPGSFLESPQVGKTWIYSYASTQKSTGSIKKGYGRGKIAAWKKVILRSGES
jgi:hypothetical protein